MIVVTPISHLTMLARFLRSRDDITRPAATPDGTVVYAIGDIHGRLDLMAEIHEHIADHARTAGRSRRVIVYLGDLVDRGPQSREVVEQLIASPMRGFETIYLKGNHEDAMLRFLDDTSIGRSWLGFGGAATLESYGVDLHGRPPDDMSWLSFVQAEFRQCMPAHHRDFYRRMKLCHVEGEYFFVHAGIRPGVTLEAQDADDMMWIRDEFLDSQEDFGKIVVHGHSIRNRPDFRPNRIGIDTGAVFSGVLTCLALAGEERRVLKTG
jgi:serine/threonine protein phosphatase 1